MQDLNKLKQLGFKEYKGLKIDDLYGNVEAMYNYNTKIQPVLQKVKDIDKMTHEQKLKFLEELLKIQNIALKYKKYLNIDVNNINKQIMNILYQSYLKYIANEINNTYNKMVSLAEKYIKVDSFLSLNSKNIKDIQALINKSNGIIVYFKTKRLYKILTTRIRESQSKELKEFIQKIQELYNKKSKLYNTYLTYKKLGSWDWWDKYWKTNKVDKNICPLKKCTSGWFRYYCTINKTYNNCLYSLSKMITSIGKQIVELQNIQHRKQIIINKTIHDILTKVEWNKIYPIFQNAIINMQAYQTLLRNLVKLYNIKDKYVFIRSKYEIIDKLNIDDLSKLLKFINDIKEITKNKDNLLSINYTKLIILENKIKALINLHKINKEAFELYKKALDYEKQQKYDKAIEVLKTIEDKYKINKIGDTYIDNFISLIKTKQELYVKYYSVKNDIEKAIKYVESNIKTN